MVAHGHEPDLDRGWNSMALPSENTPLVPEDSISATNGAFSPKVTELTTFTCYATNSQWSTCSKTYDSSKPTESVVVSIVSYLS